jgi:hypothetical protein
VQKINLAQGAVGLAPKRVRAFLETSILGAKMGLKRIKLSNKLTMK